jgi:surface antigen
VNATVAQNDPPAIATTPPPVGNQKVSVVGTNVAGFTIHTSIVPGASNVRLALETDDGQTIASEFAPDGSTSASIDAPAGTHGRVVLIVTYDRGQGQESTVKSIDIP